MLVQQRTLPRLDRAVCGFTLESIPVLESAYPLKLSVNADIPARRPSAKSCREQVQQTESLFEHLVRESEQIIGYVQP